MNIMKIAFSPIKFGIALALAVFALTAAPVFAHTYHTTLTRMDYNEKDKLIEVTIRLFNHDLGPVLEKRLKKRIDLEKTPGLDEEIDKYLGEHFVLQNQNGETKKLVWVGKEHEPDMVLVYLEIPFDGPFVGMKLQNTIFFESFAEQSNLVVARFAEKKYDLAFKAGDKFKNF
jgi:hypothetical protein